MIGKYTLSLYTTSTHTNTHMSFYRHSRARVFHEHVKNRLTLIVYRSTYGVTAVYAVQ